MNYLIVVLLGIIGFTGTLNNARECCKTSHKSIKQCKSACSPKQRVHCNKRLLHREKNGSCAGKKIVCKKLHCQDAFIDRRDEYITVWVHGIKLIGANYYHRGLNHPANFERGRNLRRLGCSLLETFDNSKNNADNVFVYSWSARYRIAERKKAAKELYELLYQKAEEYKIKHGKAPLIRVIAFSEGGNVVLSLGEVESPHKLEINECVVLGTPIQEDTSCLITSKIFKRVLYLYSLGDIVQIIAPQLHFLPIPGCPHFSGRRFYEAENLIQVETRINGLSKGHFAFIKHDFIKMLPLIIQTLNQWLDTAPAPEERPCYRLMVYTKVKRR